MGATRDLLLDLQSALAGDSEFVTWCRDTFGRAPTIQIEVVNLERLDDEDFPFIGFFEIVQDEGIARPRQSWSIKLLAAVDNPALTREQAANGTVTRAYAGRLEAEDLRERALAALFQAALGIKITASGAIVPNNFHPRYYSGTQLEIEKQI